MSGKVKRSHDRWEPRAQGRNYSAEDAELADLLNFLDPDIEQGACACGSPMSDDQGWCWRCYKKKRKE